MSNINKEELFQELSKKIDKYPSMWRVLEHLSAVELKKSQQMKVIINEQDYDKLENKSYEVIIRQ